MENTLDIIMPCRFKPEITQVCIDSVNKYTKNFNWIIIQDGEDEEMAEVLGGHDVIYNKKPKGWIEAINKGMKKSKAPYVMFLNDDIVAVPGWADQMMAYLKTRKDLAVVGPITNEVVGRQHIKNNKGDNFEEVDTLIGYCMLWKREVLEKLKNKDGYYMDPRFGFGGQEDTDMCWRAAELGYKVGIARDVFIYHYGSKAFRQMMTVPESSKAAQEKVAILQEKWGLPALKERPKVMIGIPNLTGKIVTPLHHMLEAWKQDPRYEIEENTPMNVFPLDSARNKIVKSFLEGDCDYLWFIDDDIVPPIDALDRLVKADKDIIGAVAFAIKSQDGENFPYPVTLRYDEEKKYKVYYGKGIETVDATGGACIMYKRHVFEHPSMERPYKFKYHRDGILSLTCDFRVHQKSQKAGFKIYIDFGLVCSHYKEGDIKEQNRVLANNA